MSNQQESEIKTARQKEVEELLAIAKQVKEAVSPDDFALVFQVIVDTVFKR